MAVRPGSSPCCAKHVQIGKAELSIGTLGGGNHFIEADKDEDGNIYIVIHSGSRHLGLEIANYYQEAGYRLLSFASMEIMKSGLALSLGMSSRSIEAVRCGCSPSTPT